MTKKAANRRLFVERRCITLNIEFGFENLDSIAINTDHIKILNMADRQTAFEKIHGEKSIRKVITIGEMAMMINKCANIERHEFNNIEFEKQMTFYRFLEFNDITSIHFDSEDNSGAIEHHDLYVKWTGYNEYTNDAQKTKLDDDGNLLIVIADGKRIEDFFPPTKGAS